LIKEKRLKESPNLGVAPMFREDISWVEISRDVMHRHEPSSNRLADPVKRKGVVSFVEFRMRHSRTIHDGAVVAKNKTAVTNWNTKITQSRTEVKDLIDASAGSDEFGTVGGSFDGCLFARIPIDRCLVKKVKNTSNGTAGQQVVIKIGIVVMG
jgi:hypothetical protein